MRVALVHNPSAGSENHAAADIEGWLRRNGHEVIESVAEPEGLLETLSAKACDVIAVAGGDGTVSRTACALARWGIPIAILPLGTANNTARTLRVGGDLEALVSAWSRGRSCHWDLGVVTYEGDLRLKFSEALGWGVFPDAIARAHERSLPDAREHVLARDRGLFQSVVERATPRHYELDLDGEVVRGDYLLVEVANVPFIGPRLALSPGSDPSDGRLEVVFAGESERAALLELAAHGCIDAHPRLPSRSAQRVTVRNEASRFHHDGTLVHLEPRARDYAVRVHAGAVQYLLTP